MFYKKDNASKLCFIKLVEFLGEHGIKWMDTQMVTPNVEAFGGKLISKNDFLERLEVAKSSAKLVEFVL